MPDPFSLQDNWLAKKKGRGLAKWLSVLYTNIDKFLCQINKSSDFLLRLGSDYKVGKACRHCKCEFVKEIFYHHVSSESKYCILKTRVTPSQKQLLRKMVRDLEGKSILHPVYLQPGLWDVVIM